MRQFTFGGPRAGEGYFSPDGELMIFQSERESDNPFYQIYLKNLATGDTHRVSPGYGKTTCSWIAPNKKWAIFSSTHLDPQAREKQKDEINFRNSGQQRRYSWDYDENYEIFRSTLDGKSLKNLTNKKGYDAEASISPDGKWIVFASNRLAYERPLDEKDKDLLKRDPAYFMDLYIMSTDGTNVRRLTQSPGYDGGPFFSPDGERIVWRRFSPDGHTAEVFTMKVDGTDERQITKLNAMSWAPFYHPSGDYIIFTSSLLGHHNFELFIVDTEGTGAPVRITDLDGFDGLPVFTPNGRQLTWNRKISPAESQIMIADWDDHLARQLLQLPPQAPRPQLMSPKILESDHKQIIQYLSSPSLRGRATGSEHELKAMTAIARYFQELGLSPYDGKNFIQAFDFQKDAELGSQNELIVVNAKQQSLDLNVGWRPVAFSRPGEVAASPVVFAGYGIRAPGEKEMMAYDSYAQIDVKDKWVVVLRYVPEKVSDERRLFLQRYAKLEHKAILARDLGARGIIFVSGPSSKVKSDLIPFKRLAGSNIGITAISLSDDIADQFLKLNQKNLKSLQSDLDLEKPFIGFELTGLKLSSKVDIRKISGQGHNAMALLKVPGATKTLIIGAHGDHLGDQPTDSSLKTSQDKDPIHYGADDNASGVSAVLELAHHFKHQQQKEKLKQNVLFAVWSGEELGNLGSSHFVRQIKKLRLAPSAYINMDMIGRWKINPSTRSPEPLLVQGIGSSDKWRELVEKLKLEFPVHLQNDPYLPTDAMALYMGKIPSINFFTGVHADYHTPRDTEEKINYEGLTNITHTVAKLAHTIASRHEAVPYKDVPMTQTESRRGFRIFLGTIPDYTQENITGVKLSGVITNGPAEKAGLKGGDIIVEFSSKKIENIHDYVFTLETIRPNEPTRIVVMRDGQRKELYVTPLAKE